MNETRIIDQQKVRELCDQILSFIGHQLPKRDCTRDELMEQTLIAAGACLMASQQIKDIAHDKYNFEIDIGIATLQ